jgi:two-component sensor histidine kinase
VEHYETIRRRKSGEKITISLTVSPIKNRDGVIVGASKIARDISRQKQIELQLAQRSHQLEQLNRVAKLVGRDLDLHRIVQTVTDVATELTGAQFGSFFYNVTGEQGESYMLYTLSGVPKSAFAGFPMPRATAIFEPTFHGTEVVRSEDIRRDPRYGKNAPHHGMPEGHLPVVSYLAVPVVGRSGAVLGGLFFGHDRPDVFQKEAEDLAIGIASHAALAIDNARLHQSVQDELEQRRKAEEAKELLLHEIQHRVKNTLGTVLAFAAQTFRTAPPAERKAFDERIHALANAHALLIRSNWNDTTVGEVVKQAVEPFQDAGRERFVLSGSDIALDAGRALTLAMLLHELGTNAMKYGALSSEKGTVTIDWSLVEDGKSPQLQLTWQERGGPHVNAPTRKGFGSTLIEKALSGTQGKVQLRYEPHGIICDVRMKL